MKWLGLIEESRFRALAGQKVGGSCDEAKAECVGI